MDGVAEGWDGIKRISSLGIKKVSKSVKKRANNPLGFRCC